MKLMATAANPPSEPVIQPLAERAVVIVMSKLACKAKFANRVRPLEGQIQLINLADWFGAHMEESRSSAPSGEQIGSPPASSVIEKASEPKCVLDAEEFEVLRTA